VQYNGAPSAEPRAQERQSSHLITLTWRNVGTSLHVIIHHRWHFVQTDRLPHAIQRSRATSRVSQSVRCTVGIHAATVLHCLHTECLIHSSTCCCVSHWLKPQNNVNSVPSYHQPILMKLETNKYCSNTMPNCVLVGT